MEINNLIEADFSELETDNIKSMENLFAGCKKLSKVYLDDNTPKLKSLNYTFFECVSLKTVNLNINISKVFYM